MATRQLLAELGSAWERASGNTVRFESVGGVDAARRVMAGEPFDVVVLASDAMDKLAAAGRLAAAPVDLVRSPVAVAVRAGAARPPIDSEAALRAAVEAAASIGYSTGPSGTALLALFERWGIAQQVAPRTVQARPGVPVGTLVARGEVALGFQQLSELIGVEGIDVVGTLPEPVGIVTTFAGGVCAGSPRAPAVHAMLAFMASAAATPAKQRQGMEPA